MSANLYLHSFEIASVVWRETFEALLVVGILLTWSLREGPSAQKTAVGWIAAGVASGILFAAALALIMSRASALLDGDAEEILQMIMASLASVLMLRMVFWMRRMEQGDSGGLRNEALGHVRAGNWLGLACLAALAVAREGAETVIFLYGMLSASEGWQTGIVVVSGAVGLVLAVGTFWAFRTGAAMASKKVLSRISQALLIILGSGLAMTVIDKSISLGILTPLTAPLWDLSWLLDDGRGAGAFLAGLAGYRARPELLPLLGIGAYWLTASLAYMPPLREKAPA